MRPRLWGDVESDPAEVFLHARLCCTSLPWHRYLTPPEKNWLEHTWKMCQYVSPLSSLTATLVRYFQRQGQCHFPLCMWIIEIRLSTVIVHCVEPSVIVNQNVLRDFSTQEKKKGGTNERLTTGKRHKHDTTWASIYCTLYICHSICLNMEDLKVYVN